MKISKYFLHLFFLFYTVSASGQYLPYYTLTFEKTDTLVATHARIDSNSIWQVGQPQKANFMGGYNSQRAIVTDTLNPTPTNDTSVFYVYAYVNNSPTWKYLSFRYKMFCDSLKDYGKVEISGDLGNNWLDLVRDAPIYHFYGHKDTIFTGRTNWKEFIVDYTMWYGDYNNYPIKRISDTIIYKFTYISDSTSNYTDGWEIDQIYVDLYYLYGNIHEITTNKIITIYPNPVTSSLFIKENSLIEELTIYDIHGKKVKTINNVYKEVDVRELPPGIYTISILQNQTYLTNRFIKH